MKWLKCIYTLDRGLQARAGVSDGRWKGRQGRREENRGKAGVSSSRRSDWKEA